MNYWQVDYCFPDRRTKSRYNINCYCLVTSDSAGFPINNFKMWARKQNRLRRFYPIVVLPPSPMTEAEFNSLKDTSKPVAHL